MRLKKDRIMIAAQQEQVAIETQSGIDQLLADLVEPLRRELGGAIRAAERMIKYSQLAAVRAWRGGKILDEAFKRAEEAGQRKARVYEWAKAQLGYETGQVSEARNIFLGFKSETDVIGLTLEEAKGLVGMSTAKERRERKRRERQEAARKQKLREDAEAETRKQKLREDAEAEVKKRESSDNKEKHTRGGVPGKTKLTQDDLIDDGGDEAQKTTALLLKIAELIEGVATIRDEDFQAVSRIEAHVSLLIDSIADKSDADGPEQEQAPDVSGPEQAEAPDAGEPEQDQAPDDSEPEQDQAPDDSEPEQAEATDTGEPEQDHAPDDAVSDMPPSPDEPAVGGSEQAAASREQDSVGPDRPPVAGEPEVGEIL